MLKRDSERRPATDLTSRLDIDFALAAAGLGAWEYDSNTGQLRGDDRCRQLFGQPNTDAWRLPDLLGADELPLVMQAFDQTIDSASDGTCAVTIRLATAAEPARWLRLAGRVSATGPDKTYQLNGVVWDVTNDVQAAAGQGQTEAENQRFRDLVTVSQEFICVVDLEGRLQFINPAGQALLGLETTEGASLLDYVYADDRQLAETVLTDVLQSTLVTQEIRVVNQQTGEPFWIQWRVAVMRDPQTRQPQALAIVSPAISGITSRKQTEQALEDSEARFRFAVEAAMLGVWMLDMDAGMVYWDERCSTLYGLATSEPISYLEAIQYIHDEDRGRIDSQVRDALAADGYIDLTYRTVGAIDDKLRWVRFVGRRYASEGPGASRLSGVAEDVTTLVQAQQRLSVSEAQARNLIEEAPIATCLFVGRELLIKVANKPMLAFWGKGDTPLGKPLAQAVPELVGQPFLAILDRIFTTGETYTAYNERCQLEVDGVMGTYYFDFTYKPLLDEQGQVYAIMDMAEDVTVQVMARQQIERAQAEMTQASQRLTLALEAGRLGSFEVDLQTRAIQSNDQCKLNYGLTPADTIDLDRIRASIVPGDQDRVTSLYKQALASHQVLNAEYQVHWSDQSLHWIRVSGQPIYNEQGIPVRLVGVSQEITAQRITQQDLEQQVVQRTQELQATVKDLQRSNQNLEQFAYVASHDLQEPLRKVQQFGDLIKTNHADGLGAGLGYLERMQSAASRMSALIKDLLTYSRISTRQESAQSVALADVISQVCDDLSLVITDAKADVVVGDMPTVLGDSLQLGQLFQNLVSNALKFRRIDSDGQPVKPLVQLTAATVDRADMPDTVWPARPADAYYRIDVSDNGIGFDNKYTDRIFQVFQRLHNKSAFAGTGIGLAICEKVALNHGGAITAHGQPGQGATFSVYLPVLADPVS
ncbi:PAS domain-containing sensor histidine kinase [Spirosoma luteolum]